MYAVLVLARWLHFSSLFVLLGGSVCRLLVGRQRERLAVSDPATVLSRIAAPVALVSGLAWLIASIANMTGDPAGVLDPQTLDAFFFETPFGPISALRIVLLPGLCGGALLPDENRIRLPVMAASSGTLLVSQAWLGHAAEGGATAYGAMMIAVYALHVLAGAVWVGGLPALVALLIAQRRAASRAQSVRLLRRYSAVATGAVVTIVLTGLANTAFHADVEPRILWASGYGRVLCAKLGLVAVMLALAVRNRFGLMPRLERGEDTSLAVHRLIRSIEAEIGLGLVVLGAAAVLGITPPPS